jgi:hypothetical protein
MASDKLTRDTQRCERQPSAVALDILTATEKIRMSGGTCAESRRGFRPNREQAECTTQGGAQNLRPSRAQRHSDAQLTQPPAYHIRSQPEDARHRQHRAKQSQHAQCHPWPHARETAEASSRSQVSILDPMPAAPLVLEAHSAVVREECPDNQARWTSLFGPEIVRISLYRGFSVRFGKPPASNNYC